jgi:hyaluronan synthase
MGEVYTSLKPKGCPRGFVSQTKLLYEYFKVNISFYGKLAVLINLAILIPFALSSFHADNIDLWKNELRQSITGTIFLGMGEFFFVFNTLYFAWQVYLYVKYREEPGCTDEELGMCTVIVPAFNEGKQVWKTLQSLVASDYPKDKLEILAIDDGSKDDTWYWMQKAAAEYPDRIRAIRQPRNQGKRAALTEGFKIGKGDYFVTVDSDSTVEPNTIRNLLSPMIRDPKIGAMAGNVRILNKHEGLLPIMQETRFMYSFEFVRSAQSMVGAVICTPGALSGYRRSAVMNALSFWSTQTFMGKPATIGEDRAMTNQILKQGYTVKFQRNAYVYTNVPTTLKGTAKMFLRWARSNYRESLVMGSFIFKKFRGETPVKGARIIFIDQAQTLTICQIFLLFSILFLLWHPWLFFITTLSGVAIRSLAPGLLYYYRTKSSDALWAYWYGILWVFAFSWVTPYAMFTLYKNGWLTRATSEDVPQDQQPQQNLEPASMAGSLAS